MKNIRMVINMKDKILEYIKLKPNISYFDLVKIFGLSMENLFKLLGITNYKIDNFNNLIIYDDKDNEIYREDSNGYWYRWDYDENGKQIYFEDSDDYWVKRKFDDNGKCVYRKDSDEI